ncbi:MAG: ribosome silencing factor [Chloroflexota bacterium]
MPAGPAPEGRDLALAIAEIISETPAADTRVLDVQGSSPYTDFFVICSGENERQLRAISRTLTEDLALLGVRPGRSEGGAVSGWIILDFGDTIVHIFSTEQRSYYRIEELWTEAQTVLSIQ